LLAAFSMHRDGNATHFCGGPARQRVGCENRSRPTIYADDQGDDDIVDTATASRGEVTRALAPEALIEVRLSAVRYAARDTNLYEFRRLDRAPLPAYEPGAHIDLHLPNGLI